MEVNGNSAACSELIRYFIPRKTQSYKSSVWHSEKQEQAGDWCVHCIGNRDVPVCAGCRPRARAQRKKELVRRMGRWRERARRGLNWLVAMTPLLICPELMLIPLASAQVTTEEYRGKAVYLRKIPDFVQWPAMEGSKAG